MFSIVVFNRTGNGILYNYWNLTFGLDTAGTLPSGLDRTGNVILYIYWNLTVGLDTAKTLPLGLDRAGDDISYIYWNLAGGLGLFWSWVHSGFWH